MEASETLRSKPVTVGWLRLLPSWPMLVGLLVFARLLVVRLSLLNDPDTYLHIAAGRWILAHGMLPLHDPFSYSMPGATWISSEWLAQIVLAATYAGTGWNGVVLLAAASDAAAVALLTHFLLRRFEPAPALIAAIAGAALLQPHVLARPHVLALPLLVLWAGMLLGSRDAERPPPFAALPLMVLWANTHGSYLFGLALACYLGAEAVWRPGAGRSRHREAAQWGAFIAAASVAALITPYGFAGLAQSIRLTQMPALQVTFAEWLSPNFRESPALEFWLLGVMFVGFASGVRLPLSRLLLLLGLIHMTLQHARHGDVLALVGPLAVAAPLGRTMAALMARQSPSPLLGWAGHLARPPSIGGVALAAALAIAIALPSLLQPIVRGDDAVTPASALAAAGQAGLSGAVLNSEAFGGYLIFRGVPTWIDGRTEMYGNEFLEQDYAVESGDAGALQRVIGKYHVMWTLLLPQTGVTAAMDRMPGWQRVYADNYAVVHRRVAPGSAAGPPSGNRPQ